MKGIINQYGGLGDIFFCYKIAETMLNSVDEVIWAVPPKYDFLNEYFINPKIKFVVETKEKYDMGRDIVINNDVWYLPVTYNTMSADGFDMTQKYKTLPFPVHWDKRYETLQFKRNEAREQHLIEQLGVQPSKDLTLLNMNFGTPPIHCSKHDDINIQEDNILKLDYQGWDRIFDWIPYLLNCKNLYTVETAWAHIADFFEVENVIIYPRVDRRRGCTNQSLAYCKKYYNKPFHRTWKFIEE
jgi:hypothetical protein